MIGKSKCQKTNRLMANYLEEKSGEYLEEIPIGKCYKIAGKCFGEDSGKTENATLGRIFWPKYFNKL